MASFTGITRDGSCMRKGLLYRQYRKTKEPSEALLFGKAYHKAIEEGIDAGISELGESHTKKDEELLVDMIARLQRVLIEENINIIEHEIKFEIEKEGFGGKFIGYIDAVAEKDGEMYLVEFKTARSIDVSHIPVDSQVSSYLWACREAGMYEPKGVIYIINRKTSNKKPSVLKSGDLSVAKSQGCSANDYADAIDEVYVSKGKDVPKAVENFYEWLKKNENPQITVTYTERTDEQLNIFENILAPLIKRSSDLEKIYYEKGIEQALRETPAFPYGMCMKMCQYKDECIRHSLNDVI